MLDESAYNSELVARFTYHSPSKDRAVAHERVRMYLLQMAQEFTDMLPPGREAALVMTKLEEAMFWANASIARQPSE